MAGFVLTLQRVISGLVTLYCDGWLMVHCVIWQWLVLYAVYGNGWFCTLYMAMAGLGRCVWQWLVLYAAYGNGWFCTPCMVTGWFCILCMAMAGFVHCRWVVLTLYGNVWLVVHCTMSGFVACV